MLKFLVSVGKLFVLEGTPKTHISSGQHAAEKNGVMWKKTASFVWKQANVASVSSLLSSMPSCRSLFNNDLLFLHFSFKILNNHIL